MRRTRILALSMGLLLGIGVVPVSAASAQPAPAAVSGTIAIRAVLPKPGIKVAGGASSFTVSWGKVAGAKGYVVEYSTKSSFSGVKKVSVSATTTHKVVKGLKNDVPYYVRVRAVAPSAADTSVSGAKKVTPDTGYPRELTITVVTAGPNKVKVSWTGQARATKVGVIAGSDSIVTKNLFRSAWYPATTTSITMTVPESLRDEMGTGSGNPIHVKVATYNSLTATDAMPTKSDGAKFYRLAPAGSYGYAEPVAPSGPLIRVGTWNVRSVASSAGMKGYTWKDRRLKVRDNILASGTSLLGLAELSTADAGLGNGKRQWEDLRDLLAPSGWAIANLPSTYKLKPDATNGAHLYYKTADLEVLDGGFVSPRDHSGISWPAGIPDRFWSWAQFRSKKTGTVFFAAAAHLPVDDNGVNGREKLRVAIVTAMNKFLSARAGNAPIVILGDLNSTVLKSSSGADNALRRAGYYDAASALKRSSNHYATVNHVHQIDNLKAVGYPYTPYRAPHAGSRLDYIMVKNAPGSARYTNQMLLTPTGKFDTRYQGSDHNLQWAEIGILAGPTASSLP
jgi:endonuclease/exonuclease/phosphatase family metal-dependent hydrolase